MIALLKIQNLALVENLVWEVGSGLVGITGETGAGKSVIVGALKLVLGERADRGLVRTGCDACTVEAVFDLERPEEVNAVLAEAGLDACEDGQLVVRRVIGAASGGAGKTVANKQFINCSPVTLGVLKAMGQYLVDLHGPHDHQSLLSRERQLSMLDAYAGAVKEGATYRDTHRAWRELQEEHDALANSERANEQEIDLLKHQIAEIEEAEIQTDEAEELERRYRVANNSSHLVDVSKSIAAALGEDEGSIIASLSDLARMIRDLEKHDPSAAEFTGSFDTALVELEELGDNLRRYTDGLEIDPAALRAIEQRLDLLETLKRKYGNTLAEVLEFQAEAEGKLAKIEGRGDELARLRTEIAAALKKRDLAAKKLSAKRRKAAPKLAKEVAAHLEELGFKRAGFSVELEKLEVPNSAGAEAADFMFSPNPGEPAKPLRVIASSGEMSRVMLAVKSALAREDSIPLLVFDEIDANVGGEIAQAVGAKMASLGSTHQVIAITHLPQVASLANCQYVVNKEFGKDGRTRSRLREVIGDERIAELARMLGGSQKSARRHAESLLETAA
jgi:DNA repair protein RecN (Recombination protein N)